MDLPLSFKVEFADVAGDRIDTPREWQKASMQITANVNVEEIWKDIKLVVNGQVYPHYLRCNSGQAIIYSSWPRSNTGEYFLEISFSGRKFSYSFSVLPEKISLEELGIILKDFERLPAMIAVALQRIGALNGVKLIPQEATIPQELERVRNAINGNKKHIGLKRILCELNKDFHKKFYLKEVWVRRAFCRRPAVTQLGKVIAKAGNITSERGPEEVIDYRVEFEADVFENRLVRNYYDQVYARATALEAFLARTNNKAAVTEIREMKVMLERALRQSFLNDVKQLQKFSSISMVLLKKRPYRAALEGFVEFQKSPIIQIEEPALDAPMENIPKLYQGWCVLNCIHALIETASVYGYRIEKERIVQRKIQGFWLIILQKGTANVELISADGQVTIKLFHEKSYGTAGDLHSISFRQRPDISIEVSKRGAPTEIFILDPKYKLDSEFQEENSGGNPKKVDIDKMHSYRDSIRQKGGGHAVSYAGILYPGKYQCYGLGLEALPARPKGKEVLRQHLDQVMDRVFRSTS